MNVSDLLLGGSAWWMLPCSLLGLGAVFGLLPGVVLRLIVLLYPKGHPRREELFGELYDPEMGRFERFEWVFQQLETASRQGLPARRQERAQRRAKRAQQRNEQRVQRSSDKSESTPKVDTDSSFPSGTPNPIPAFVAVRKIGLTLLMGAISFPFTQLLFSDLAGQLAASATFGSITLFVQFLTEIGHRIELTSKLDRSLVVEARRFGIVLTMGAISFPFVQLLFSDLAGEIAASLTFGGATLIIQFLIEIERRLGRAEPPPAEIIRRIGTALLMGAISFPFTQLLFSDLAGQIAASLAFGGATLIIQFLIEIERRLDRTESRGRGIAATGSGSQ